MEPLATIDDVLRLGVDVSDMDLVTFLLDSVSDAVRDAAGSPISLSEVTISREGTWDQDLLLPMGPIREVTEVLLDDELVGDWKLRAGRLWRSQGWGDSRSDVTVTYLWGVDRVPADIVKLVATLVAAGINEVANGVASTRGLAYLSIDDYREGYRQGDKEVVDLTEIPQRTRDMLRERFSGGVSVSRSL